MKQIHIKRTTALIVLVVILAGIATTQTSPPFIFIIPILLIAFFVCWFLYKEIQKDREEALKRGVKHEQEEKEAQTWLHKSFIPKVRTLAEKNIRSIIIISGMFLISFVFLWSFFVSGLLPASLNAFFSLFLYCTFIVYTLYAPKEFSHLFKHVPQRYRHHSKNDWVHGYLLLFPFVAIIAFFYSMTTVGQDIIANLSTALLSLFSFTLLFICVYCLWYLYDEYQKEIKGR